MQSCITLVAIAFVQTINSHHVSQLIINDYRANDFVTINHHRLNRD